MSTINPQATNVTIKQEGIFWVVYVNGLEVKPRYRTKAEAEAYAATL